ncbi:DUF6993 domain-containing protein [Protaetiibacter intestinalis]|uniref:DUF6993 domain-containing protein n=1 Tax=Protaetiibacter intestinalis TaxID=2419774 RepID=A0A387B5M8_9MICO|nr:hypothetical protein [Protaetiibacter intestinalis]AYF97048.1 hypothetical protein D7I47_01465 [Protaetiibacter intestinalis]
MTRPRRALACAAAALAAAVLLAGCTTPEPEPTPSETPTASATPTPTPTPTSGPELDGTAADNQEYFDTINRELIDSGVALGGAAFIDNLVAHGFPREAMEVTPDTTAIGVAADNIVFSIRFADSCLLGQWGNIGYTSLVTELPANGRCIIGTARPA